MIMFDKIKINKFKDVISFFAFVFTLTVVISLAANLVVAFTLDKIHISGLCTIRDLNELVRETNYKYNIIIEENKILLKEKEEMQEKINVLSEDLNYLYEKVK